MKFPKLIVIVMDSDFTKTICNVSSAGTKNLLDVGIQYLIKTIHRLVWGHKEVLPSRAVKQKYPTVLWIMPPGHCNFNDNCKRQACSDTIKAAVMQFNEMRFTKLLSWDFNDATLVAETAVGYRFTSKRLLHYWLAVDSAIKTWETARLQQKALPGRLYTGRHNRREGHQWSKPKSYFKW